jgi:tripartite-type tricarboxylate transporter receptor subunit TctC
MVTRSPGYTRLLLTAPVLVAVALPDALAQDAATSPAQAYPSRPIRIVVAIPSGSGTDTVARLIAQGLSERLGRQVVVENRPGAGTIIGNEIVAKAKPDGYTLLMNGAALTISPAMYKKIPYDTLHDFAPVTVAVFTPNLMAVHPSVPAKSVQEMIALAKARPGQILFSSGGRGTNSHLATELFASMAQIRLVHVPYKGSTPGVIDLMAGHVALMTNSVATLLAHVQSGKLRALGVASTRRVAAAPGIPTIAEAGLPGYESVQWSGLLAPAGTPQEIIAKLHRETIAILRAPDMRVRLAGDGSELVANSPEEFAAFLKAELVKWAAVVKATGITPE